MRRTTYLSIFLLALVVATAASAAGPLAKIDRSDSAIQWTPKVQSGTLVLTISGPQGFYHRQRFDQGTAPSFSVFTQSGGTLPEGAYAWELVLEPSVSKADREAMAAARSADAGGLLNAIGVAPSKGTGYASGYFGVLGGSFVTQEGESSSALSSAAGASSSSLEGISSEVVLTNGDGVIRNSLCVGFDCPDAPAFGDSTILLMENNTRIKFGDTSNSPFPNNDWEIEANSSLSGGANYLGFNDCGTADNDGGCASDLVFAVESGARANALYVESDGDIGVGTSNPVVDIHIVTGNTPTVRLDQDGTSGFTPQVWDIAGNETNFFVRDATNGSRLPFRIQPNAPTNSIFVAGSTGRVGLGTSSPDASLHVSRTDATANVHVKEGNGTAAQRELLLLENNGGVRFALFDTNNGSRVAIRNVNAQFQVDVDNDASPELRVAANGDVTIDGAFITPLNTYADYVFEDGYQLMPLSEVAVFIKANRHLPTIPSAKTVQENGGMVNMSALQMKLLEKIEELTLYAIQQDKDLSALSQDNRNLKERLATVDDLQTLVLDKDQQILNLQQRLTSLESAVRAMMP